MSGVRDLPWRLGEVSAERLDQLPFGAIVVDPNGMVVAYNDYESRLARREREAVLGKNFFREVAPCTAVREFQGRFDAFVRAKAEVSESFAYFFPFFFGTVEVRITFIKLVSRGQVLIAVERVSAPPADA